MYVFKCVCAWRIWNIIGLASKTIYFKVHCFPFEVILLESNVHLHPSLPCRYPLLKEFFWDASQLHRFNLLGAFKTVLPVDPQSWEERKGYGEQDQVNREMVPVQRCSTQSRTAECLAYSNLIFFRHSQICDNIPNTFSCPAHLPSFIQSTDICHPPSVLLAQLWPQSCLQKAFISWRHLLNPDYPR